MDSENILIKSINIEISIKQVKLNNYNINYITAGSGKPLILIHGANIGWGQWYRNIADLSRHFKVYAIDLPGSGQSTKIDFHKTKVDKVYIDIVRKFVEYQKLRSIYYVGHSIGGWIGVKLACQYDFIKKLVLVNPVGFSKYVPIKYKILGIYSIASFLSKTLMTPSKKNMRVFLQSAVVDHTTIEENFVNYYYESVIREKVTHPFLLINKISNFFSLRKEFQLNKEILELRIPTLFVIGDKDILTPLAIHSKLIRKMKDAQLLRVRNSSHVPSLEKSEKFNNSVIHFLK